MTTVHPAFDSRIFHKECRGLAEAGCQVTLLAVHEQDETRHGVSIEALPSPRGRIDRMVITTGRVLRRALGLNGDVYHFHDPELIPVGLLLKAAGKCVVYDVHEDVPLDMLQKPYLPPWARKVLGKAASAAHKVADWAFDGIVVVTPTVGASFKQPTMVRNFPIVEEFLGDGTPYEERDEVFAYVGAVDPVRGSDHMRDAAASVNRRLMLAGPVFDPDLLAELTSLSEDDTTRYLGVLDRDGVRDLLHSARAGVVVLSPDNAGYVDSYPIKLFEYMAAGLPVVAADFPVIREIVEGAECGVLVDPTSREQIAKAFQWILDNPSEAAAMGQRGRRAVLAEYTWAGELDRLLALYGRIRPAVDTSFTSHTV